MIIDYSANLHNLAAAAAIADLSNNRKLAVETHKRSINISKYFTTEKAKPYLAIAAALEKRFEDLVIESKTPKSDKINLDTASLINPEEQRALKTERIANSEKAKIDTKGKSKGLSIWVLIVVSLVVYGIGVAMGRRMKT